MSESEQQDPKYEAQNDSATETGTKQEETEVESKTEVLTLIENGVTESKDVPKVTVEGAGDEVDAEGDSEAETLIQSPEKKRGSIAESANTIQQVKLTGSDAGSIILNMSDKENATRKRKRSNENGSRQSPSRLSRPTSHHSSPLSSPVVHPQSDLESEDSDTSSRRSSSEQQDRSDAEKSIDLPKKRRRRPSEIVPPSPHKRSKRNSADTLERRETRSATYPRPSSEDERSSPERSTRREHRRGASTQLIVGEFEKKKRGRPPMLHTKRNQSADRASDSSGESEPRTGRARPFLNKFTSNDQDTMSPAKVGPRKWKDKNGRTYLARACANNDLEAARARLIDRPEDLNIGDNAGNTPLQIASLEGFEEIVEFLLSKGADANVRNVDKDTPLIDSVENGHIEVIKLLLKYGANPRMGNAKGDEPSELVNRDDEEYEQIRRLLTEAKNKDAKKTPGVDAQDFYAKDGQASRAASAASPRDSPPIGGGPRSPPAHLNSRRRTGRSESTRNDLLWQANTQENLAKLAGKGDVQGVANILSILERADTEALIAAAKAGHEEVLQLLIAMGNPNIDPEPVRSSKAISGYNTPILAAIGRGHPDVVKLLANQSGFNPCRKYKEKTYYEIAAERRGDRWEEEHKVLKDAFEGYKSKKSSSPRKTRDADKVRPRRSSSSVADMKRQIASPTQTHRSLPTKSSETSPNARRKASDPEKHRPNGDADSAIAIASDADHTVAAIRKTHRTRRSQSDLPAVPALESEPSQKRRRLVTGKEHRNRQTASTSSDNEDSEMTIVKEEERPQSALKRSRVNSTPEPPGDGKDRKKRRTVLESSPDDVRPRTSISSDPASTVPTSIAEIEKVVEADDFNASTSTDAQTSGTNTESVLLEKNNVKQEPESVEEDTTVKDAEVLPDAEDDSEEPYSPPPAVVIANVQQEDEQTTKEDAARAAAEEAERLEETRRAEEAEAAKVQAAEEEKKQREAEQKRMQEAADAARRQEEERQERLRQEAESRRRQEQIERERRRLDALPIVLARTAQMIDENNSLVREQQWLNKYLPLYCVKTRQLDSYCDEAVADVEWLPNFQVAGLLSTKDLSLLNFTSFDKRSVTPHERHCIWRVARLKLSYDFNPLWTTSVDKANEIESVAQAKFMAMQELFWVKLADFLEQVPRFPHLHFNLPRQTMSLKTYSEILGPRLKAGALHNTNIPNGIMPHNHINGENGIT